MFYKNRRDDIDGEPRSLATPDIGADAFFYSIYVPVIDVSSHSLNINVYPNPATDKLQINAQQKSEIEIFNINGQIIKTIFAQSKETIIDLTDLSNGIYIVKAKTDKEIEIKKIIKE